MPRPMKNQAVLLFMLSLGLLLYKFFQSKFSSREKQLDPGYTINSTSDERRSLIPVRARRSSSQWYGMHSENSKLIIVLVCQTF